MVAEAPEGCQAFFIQNKNLSKYSLMKEGFEEGPYQTENFEPWKLVNRAGVVEEMEKVGFMCDFFTFASQIASVTAEDLLVICDPAQLYGDNWFICLTDAAREREWGVITKVETDRLALEEAVRLEHERLAAEEKAAADAVYEDTPVVARPYGSESAEVTGDEVEALTVRPERPLIEYTLVRPLESFGLAWTFSDRLADNEKYLEHRAQKNPDFELQRKEAEVSLQASPSCAAVATQTTKFRAVATSTQYERGDGDGADELGVASSQPPVAAVAQAFSSALDLVALEPEDVRLANFLARARPVVEQALQQNETVDVFTDAFAKVGDDEAGVSSKGENELKELRTFNDIKYSKSMSLCAIDWHPTMARMLAVSPVHNRDFDEKVRRSGQAFNSYILLWDFVDLIHPQLMLQSPQEISAFQFNARGGGQSHLVAAGASNGQVVLWDIKDAIATLVRRQHRSSVRGLGGASNSASPGRGNSSAGLSSSSGGGGGGADDDDDEARPPPVKPRAISHLDATHKRAVADLCWLPCESQVNWRGQLLFDRGENTDGPSHQFITVSGDGQVLFWDVRFKEIAEGKHPELGRKQQSEKPGAAGANGAGKDGKGAPAPTWLPLFRMQLKRLEGVGELSLCRVCLGLANSKTDPDAPDRRSQLLCSSEEGEIVCADWRPSSRGGQGAVAAGAAAGKGANAGDAQAGADDEADDDETPEYVQWMAPDHSRPATVLERSPFFPDLVLSVGDWNFQLWKCDATRPIYSSPQASVSLTTGCWSPTRPGMLYMARADGSLDVWDLTDSSYRPAAQLNVAPTRVTSLKFLQKENAPQSAAAKQHLLAVGDKAGNLHVFDVPRNLWRPAPNEQKLMRSFIAGEVARVEYVNKRSEFRKQEHEQNVGDEDSLAGGNSVAGGGNSPDADGKQPPHAQPEELEFTAEELEEINRNYQQQQAKFVSIMGLNNKPLSSSSISLGEVSVETH